MLQLDTVCELNTQTSTKVLDLVSATPKKLLAASSCVCGASFTVEHVLFCHHGVFPSLRHNEIRDITVTLTLLN